MHASRATVIRSVDGVHRVALTGSRHHCGRLGAARIRLAVDRAAWHVDEVIRAAVDDPRSGRSELEPHRAEYYIQARLMLPMVVPACARARSQAGQPRPQNARSDRLLPGDPGQLSAFGSWALGIRRSGPVMASQLTHHHGHSTVEGPCVPASLSTGTHSPIAAGARNGVEHQLADECQASPGSTRMSRHRPLSHRSPLDRQRRLL
jgi:hypothetical protein